LAFSASFRNWSNSCQIVASALGDELDLDRAFRAGVGREARGRDRHLIDRPHSNRREAKEARIAAPEPLRVVVDAVERDVDGASRQSVEGTVAVGAAGGRARREEREAEHVAARQRQLRDLLVAHRGRHRAGRRLDDRRGAHHLHLLLHAGNLESHFHVRRAPGIDCDALDVGRLEPLGHCRQAVTAGLQVWEDEAAVIVAVAVADEPAARIIQHEIRMGDDRAGRILQRAIDPSGRAHLRARDRRRQQRCKPNDDDDARLQPHASSWKRHHEDSADCKTPFCARSCNGSKSVVLIRP